MPDIEVGAIMVGCVVSDLVLTSVDDRPSDRSCISSRVGILLRSSARFAICARASTWKAAQGPGDEAAMRLAGIRNQSAEQVAAADMIEVDHVGDR